MSYGLLLPNLTYNLFAFQPFNSGLITSSGINFASSTDFTLHSVVKYGIDLSFSSSSDFSYIGSVHSVGSLTFNSSSDFSVNINNFNLTQISGFLSFNSS